MSLQGYLILRGFIDQQTVAKWKSALADHIAASVPGRFDLRDDKTWPDDDGFADFAEALKAHEVDADFKALANQYKAFIKKCTAAADCAAHKRAAEDAADLEEESRRAKSAKTEDNISSSMYKKHTKK